MFQLRQHLLNYKRNHYYLLLAVMSTKNELILQTDTRTILHMAHNRLQCILLHNSCSSFSTILNQCNCNLTFQGFGHLTANSIKPYGMVFHLCWRYSCNSNSVFPVVFAPWYKLIQYFLFTFRIYFNILAFLSLMATILTRVYHLCQLVYFTICSVSLLPDNEATFFT